MEGKVSNDPSYTWRQWEAIDEWIERFYPLALKTHAFAPVDGLVSIARKTKLSDQDYQDGFKPLKGMSPSMSQIEDRIRALKRNEKIK